MEIVILGEPRTKKNHPVIARGKGGRPFILPSQQYRNYEQIALSQIGFVDRVDYPVNVKCKYYMKTRRKVDLCNLLEATCDILVKAGVLADDCSSIVAAHNGSGVFYDKDNPRVEIEIEAIEVQANAL